MTPIVMKLGIISLDIKSLIKLTATLNSSFNLSAGSKKLSIKSNVLVSNKSVNFETSIGRNPFSNNVRNQHKELPLHTY